MRFQKSSISKFELKYFDFIRTSKNREITFFFLTQFITKLQKKNFVQEKIDFAV